MRGFQHLSLNDGIYTIYIQWELNTGPTSHTTVIEAWISLIWVDCNHEIQKMPDLLWAAVRGSLTLVFISFLITCSVH